MAVQKIIDWLKSYGTSHDDGRCFAVKFHDEPWMEFSAEWQDWSSLEEGREILYFGYYFEENGDLCQDPEFKITLQDGKVTNVSQLNWALGAVDATADPYVTEFAEEVWRRHFENRTTTESGPSGLSRMSVAEIGCFLESVANVRSIFVARDASGDTVGYRYPSILDVVDLALRLADDCGKIEDAEFWGDRYVSEQEMGEIVQGLRHRGVEFVLAWHVEGSDIPHLECSGDPEKAWKEVVYFLENELGSELSVTLPSCNTGLWGSSGFGSSEPTDRTRSQGGMEDNNGQQ